MTDLQPAYDLLNRLAPAMGVNHHFSDKYRYGTIPGLIMADMVDLINEGRQPGDVRENETNALYEDAIQRLAVQAIQDEGRVVPIDLAWFRTNTFGRVYMALLRGKPEAEKPAPKPVPATTPDLGRLRQIVDTLDAELRRLGG